MLAFVILCFCLIGVNSVPAGLEEKTSEIPAVEPEHLDKLLAAKNYDEFNRLMGIDVAHLSHPRQETASTEPWSNKGLFTGDILLTPKQLEQARQGIRFDVYPGNKWPNGEVPYSISYQFTRANRQKIRDAVNVWNQQNECVKFKPRSYERDYVNFFPGNGCYSNLGKVGKQQPISLAQNGCFSQGTILHEMNHAIGFTHEQNRYDRDDYIKVLFENIPEEWRSQYEKTSPDDFGLQGPYDYYSVMHYPVRAPGTGKPAFEVLDNSIDQSQIGQRQGLTDIDKQKISKQYC